MNSTPPNAVSTPPAEPLLVCSHLTKTFRDFWLRHRVRAVDSLDLQVSYGEVYGLLGPNGSGKSTTIKMILGLLHPTAGRIAVFGKRPDDVATKNRIGYLPEESYLYPFLTARETLDYYGRLFHQDRHQRQRRIDMLLDMVALTAAQHRPVGEYSKGMQRRIGLAQALINDPQLLILDEPTTGLDPIGTRLIKDLILELRRRGKTVLLCSHLLADVEDVCDRISIMYGGKIRAEGRVDDLLVREDQTIIQTPPLDPPTIQAVEQLLERRGAHIQCVDRPRQRLEALFLEIVHRAQQEVAGAGSAAGGRLAEFLTGDAESSQPAHVLEQLTKPTAPAPPPASPAPEPPQPPQPAHQVLDHLVKAAPQAEPQAPPRAEGSGTAVPQPDRDFLDRLVHGDRNPASAPPQPTQRPPAP